MSDFVMIAPAGWTPLDFDRIQNTLNISIEGLKSWANSSYFIDIEPVFKADGMIPEDASIAEMKVIDDSQVWVRLG